MSGYQNDRRFRELRVCGRDLDGVGLRKVVRAIPAAVEALGGARGFGAAENRAPTVCVVAGVAVRLRWGCGKAPAGGDGAPGGRGGRRAQAVRTPAARTRRP